MQTDLHRRRWPVTSLCVLRDALVARGGAMAPYLRVAGLDAALLETPGAEVTAADEMRVIEACLADLGHPEGFGLEVGPRYRVAAYGVWGFALLASPNLRAALMLGLEYQDLTYSIMPIDFRPVGGNYAVIFDDGPVAPDLRRYMAERDIAAARRIAEDLWGHPPACRGASFRFPAPADPAPYEAALQCPVTFGAEVNALFYDHMELESPLPQANPVLAALNVEACNARLRALRGEDSFVERVTGAILARPGHFPAMEDVAAHLGMAPRTLRRRLGEKGIGYRDLVARLRQDLATEMLSEVGLRVEAVAERLGYAETASFTHAFRRWTGVSPSTFARRR
ncbi:AraC family transcriptional regulator [Zavarzinia compransoris]|uniref:AraC family transcriptional regulator n=1 Tax=Zavarzinia marina TaxID=2911065 RepID=UPI001F15CF5D|nr:AraC family transcriptional regulator [Zavarzinia marina]MCF4165407.1 AraC family transcriptional regulator [Zavarzinia marina]